MSVVVRSDVLRYELARRGLAAMDLARASGLSAATISSALAGHPISVKSLQLMAAVLMRVPVIEVIDGLVSSCSTEAPAEHNSPTDTMAVE